MGFNSGTVRTIQPGPPGPWSLLRAHSTRQVQEAAALVAPSRGLVPLEELPRDEAESVEYQKALNRLISFRFNVATFKKYRDSLVRGREVNLRKNPISGQWYSRGNKGGSGPNRHLANTLNKAEKGVFESVLNFSNALVTARRELAKIKLAGDTKEEDLPPSVRYVLEADRREALIKTRGTAQEKRLLELRKRLEKDPSPVARAALTQKTPVNINKVVQVGGGVPAPNLVISKTKVRPPVLPLPPSSQIPVAKDNRPNPTAPVRAKDNVFAALDRQSEVYEIEVEQEEELKRQEEERQRLLEEQRRALEEQRRREEELRDRLVNQQPAPAAGASSRNMSVLGGIGGQGSRPPRAQLTGFGVPGRNRRRTSRQSLRIGSTGTSPGAGLNIGV